MVTYDYGVWLNKAETKRCLTSCGLRRKAKSGYILYSFYIIFHYICCNTKLMGGVEISAHQPMKGIYYFEIEMSGIDRKDGQQESSKMFKDVVFSWAESQSVAPLPVKRAEKAAAPIFPHARLSHQDAGVQPHICVLNQKPHWFCDLSSISTVTRGHGHLQ